MADYGYTAREDPPGRAIPSQTPTSRVTSPPRTESRALEAAIKAPPEAEPFLIMQMMMGNNVVPIGNAGIGLAGAYGSAVVSYGWQAATNRYGRRARVTGGNGAGGGYHAALAFQIITPRAWLDPLWIGSRGPAIVRLGDVVRFTKDSVPTTAGWVTARWGYGADVPNTLYRSGAIPAFLGFYCFIASGASTGTWKCEATDAAKASLFSVDTGIVTAGLHRLEVELNAKTGTVRWFIDHVLVGEWSPGSGQVAADVGGPTKVWLMDCQAQRDDTTGVDAIATLDYGLDGWLSAVAAFDSPVV